MVLRSGLPEMEILDDNHPDWINTMEKSQSQLDNQSVTEDEDKAPVPGIEKGVSDIEHKMAESLSAKIEPKLEGVRSAMKEPSPEEKKQGKSKMMIPSENEQTNQESEDRAQHRL
ncbi:UNVERIFIED_CONTAM: hypothetical protein PYX00_007499 [Menopon gallinae]|uniref:Uncharacterized protein n=1 Tax=Menopon gallinae TaxID=328185 RepID=A0AAW2HJJ5_9NEOP